MSGADVSERRLLNRNEVFADVFNVYVFGGRRAVLPEDLEDVSFVEAYLTHRDELREMRRDTAKLWRKRGLIISLMGVESQSSIDPTMPLRIVGYDGVAYREQINRNAEQGSYYPVVTLVLYFGPRPWKKRLSLLDILSIPEDIRADIMPFLSDYKTNVVDVGRSQPEQIAAMRSDFRMIAQGLYDAYHDVKTPTPNSIYPQDAESIVLFMTNVLGLRLNPSFCEQVVAHKKEVTMNEIEQAFIDLYTNDGIVIGRKKGLEEGRKEGREEGQCELYARLIKSRLLTVEEAAALENMSVPEFKARVGLD